MPKLEIIFPICVKGCRIIRDAEFLEDIRYASSGRKDQINFSEEQEDCYRRRYEVLLTSRKRRDRELEHVQVKVDR